MEDKGNSLRDAIESLEPKLVIEAGKKYLCVDGSVVGPLIDNHVISSKAQATFRWSWNSPDEGWLSWTAEGRWNRLQKSRRDIWVEWPGEEAKTAPEAAQREAKLLTLDEIDKTFAQLGQRYSKPEPLTKHGLLDLAKQATADRGLNYGKQEDNFKRIADLWTAHLTNRVQSTAGPHFITPTDVAIMCALLKVARLENEPGHLDSWVDLAGYAACGAEIALAPKAKPAPDPVSMSDVGKVRVPMPSEILFERFRKSTCPETFDEYKKMTEVERRNYDKKETY